jgi:hypothetical protein
MLAEVAFLLAVQAAPAPAAAPDRALLDAFRGACARVDRLEHMQADAAAGGWVAVEADADPRLARLVRLGREAVGADARVSGGQYRREHAGRPLYLVVSRFEDEDGLWGNGCRLYDFAAAAPLPLPVLQAWMNRPPTGGEDFGPMGSRRLWEPGWRDGVTVDISHVPAGSPLVETLGFSGNILIAQAIGGF